MLQLIHNHLKKAIPKDLGIRRMVEIVVSPKKQVLQRLSWQNNWWRINWLPFSIKVTISMGRNSNILLLLSGVESFCFTDKIALFLLASYSVLLLMVASIHPSWQQTTMPSAHPRNFFNRICQISKLLFLDGLDLCGWKKKIFGRIITYFLCRL